MKNYNDLVEGIKQAKDVEEYFKEFFVKDNCKEYKMIEGASKKEIKALKVLFESKRDLLVRVEDAFKLDPLCPEAMFVYHYLADEMYVFDRYEAYYDQKDEYADFTYHQKFSYIQILDLYVEFLLDIQNMTYALKVQKLIIKLTNQMNAIALNRFSFIYNYIENWQDAYRLYLDNDFDAYDYLLLLVTLLKHDEKQKAREVLLDMLKNIEDAEYIDHIWELSEKSKFFIAVNNCYDQLQGVPLFFPWASETIKNNRV